MTMRRAVVLLLAFGMAACSTTPAPSTAPQPKSGKSSASSPSATRLQAEEYRRALEAAYGEIVAREGKPVIRMPAAETKVDLPMRISIPIPEHETIRGALQYFTTDLRPSIQESLIRSAKYKNLIEQALDENQLPRGLAYLPVIESAYVPTLTSRAGAHGIWQFMPETARDYGLRVDWWIDERADPERSTKAAAVYLRDLYKQFNDWPLALAAYNAGPGRIRRAMASTGASTFWELLEAEAVPKETRGYVPTFFATLTIASDPVSYGFRLGKPAEPDHRPVEVEGPLSLRYLASIAKVDERLLRELNPALRHEVLPPGKTIVHVPSKAAATVIAQAATMKNEDSSIAICTYTLREGQSLRRLARSIGSDVDTLLSMNNLHSDDSVGEGDSIYLPVRARELGALLAHNDTYYAVRKGDTYYSIAKSHHLSVVELLQLNELGAGHKLHPGERLRVSAARGVTAGM